MIFKYILAISILFSLTDDPDSTQLKTLPDSIITKDIKSNIIQFKDINSEREIKFDKSKLAPQNVRIIFNDFFKKYIGIKESLVYKDSYGAGNKTLTLLEAMKSKSDIVNKEIKDARWEIFINNYDNIRNKVKSNKFISDQRFTFSEVSRGLENFIKQYGLYNKTVYLMEYRNDSLNVNSQWMSDKKDFKNPYTGDLKDTVYTKVKEVWIFE